jgi:hypothetical protein
LKSSAVSLRFLSLRLKVSSPRWSQRTVFTLNSISDNKLSSSFPAPKVIRQCTNTIAKFTMCAMIWALYSQTF